MAAPVDQEDQDSVKDENVVDPSRLSRTQRVKMFVESMGLTMNDMLEALKKHPVTMEEASVHPDVREMVIDLKASGCPDEVVARFMRISVPHCRRLFEWELDNGLALRTGQVVRGLMTNAIHLGDTSAQMGYLKLQPDLKWGSKHKNENIEPPPDPESVQEQRIKNEAFIAGITAGLAIDTTKHGITREAPKPKAEVAKPKGVTYAGTVVRKVKGD
jgi:hypothetical protein